MNRLNFTFLVPLLFLLIIEGCGTLDPAGPYQGDKALYSADVLLATSYDTIDSFLVWETKARGTPACPKAATQAADALRKDAPKAFSDAWAAREAYASVKNDANSTALQKTLSVVRSLLTIAVSWTAQRAQHP